MLTTAPARTRVPDGFEPGPLRIGRAVFRYHGGVRARLVILIALSFAVAPLAGCRTRAPAGRYQKDGLSFEHPEGWQVTNDLQKRARTVTVMGPAHAVLTISVFAPHLDVSLDTFVNAASKARGDGVKKELTVAGVNLGGETPATAPATPIKRSVAGKQVRGYEEHFTIEGVSVPVPHTSEYLIFKVGDRAVIVMEQVADKERHRATSGFQRIVDTIAVAP